ncbi:peptidoglycan DD-metalloendopeptidase family protein [Ornithinibacillus halophilus]|uniref:Murein DD-endopeptidase MepM and murein hydrolase activator NlpD, contain LysM domain n=1 Tax=Ornithinibacillus halophilus TaxID=930117 RepID=A0A1M5G0I3_9BACI|nr:M23 family metallopeptidase [Ornithinibacillus halophilus]SHF97238.1 Murein DD-endopeptidase MepM and murein hydrolase activator NlpD, contain LysM domain [Ornithinibacillus halophilus]
MFQFKNRESNKNHKPNLVKKIALTTTLGMMITFGVVFAEETQGVQTVHHVYVDGKHLGEISDRSIVEEIIEKKIEAGKETYENVDVTVGEDISYVTELAFNPSFSNQQVSNRLEDLLSVKAEAVELKIDDETVGYFKDEVEAETTLQEYKLKYVDEEILEQLEAQSQADVEIDGPHIADEPKTTELAIGESTILDVTLSKEVSLSEEKVKPDEILSVEDGLKLLEKGTLTEEKHRVKEGEVLGKIATNYDLTLDELLELNPSLSEDSLLQIDQEINVTALKPFIDVIVIKEEKKAEEISYQTEVVESEELYKGDQKVRQNGSKGKKEVQYRIEIKNGQVADKEVIEEEVIKEPVNKVIVKGTKVIPSRGTGEFSWPTVGGYISSHVGQRWGRLHKGIDIARPSNRAILAADNGTVVEARYDGGFGNKVVINHNNGYKTVYAHLSSIKVRVGQTVPKGTTIGIMGSTGNSTGVHLHFELYKNGVLKNPLNYLY